MLQGGAGQKKKIFGVGWGREGSKIFGPGRVAVILGALSGWGGAVLKMFGVRAGRGSNFPRGWGRAYIPGSKIS